MIRFDLPEEIRDFPKAIIYQSNEYKEGQVHRPNSEIMYDSSTHSSHSSGDCNICVPRKWKSIYNTSAGLSYIYYMYALQGCSAVFDLISVVSLSSLGLIGLMSFRFSGLSCSVLSINFFIIFFIYDGI